MATQAEVKTDMGRNCMEEYDSPEARLILAETLLRIKDMAEQALQLSTSDRKREALNNIRDRIEAGFNEYRREIGKVQKAEIEELRRQAAALKG